MRFVLYVLCAGLLVLGTGTALVPEASGVAQVARSITWEHDPAAYAGRDLWIEVTEPEGIAWIDYYIDRELVDTMLRIVPFESTWPVPGNTAGHQLNVEVEVTDWNGDVSYGGWQTIIR